jgi:T-complex protein 1 subunit eta
MQTTVNDLTDEVLGTCDLFEERQIGGDRYNLFSGCPSSKSSTIILRGGTDQFLAESERSLHDAIMVIKRTIQNTSIVAGGGAIEMELSKFLKDYSRTIKGKAQFIINAYAKALETIPKQLSENAGLDPVDIVNELRKKHEEGGTWFGVDIINDGVCDTMKSHVWEPSLIKKNALTAATEACNLILSVDQTVKNPESDQRQHEAMRGRQQASQYAMQ